MTKQGKRELEILQKMVSDEKNYIFGNGTYIGSIDGKLLGLVGTETP